MFIHMPREYRFYVYMMQSSSRRALYIGMTNNLHRRVFEHKTQQSEGFAAAYDAVRLVYWESFDDVANAIDREKQLKRWRREKKLWLVGKLNPKWKDLAADWYKPATGGASNSKSAQSTPKRTQGPSASLG